MPNIKKLSASTIILAIALLALAASITYSLVTYAGLAASALTFRYPLDYGEGPLLDQTLRLADGENIYRTNISAPPYTISNYPPVFLLLQAPFSRIFGPAFWYGRLISIISALVTAACISLTLYQLAGNKISAVISGLLFISFPYIQYWTNLNRIDSLALALSWAALAVLARWSGKSWGIPLTTALFILSIYTRQSYALAAPFGAFVWLLFERQWRKAIQLAGLTAGIGLVIFLLINLLTQGGFFFNIVTANVNPFYWNTVCNYAKDIGCVFLILLTLIVIFLAGDRFHGKTRSWPLALFYLVGAILSGITIGKDGSNVNYLLELSAALSFAGGASLAWLSFNRWIKTLAIIALCIQISIMAAWVQNDFADRIMGRIRQENDIEKMFQIVQETDGVVLADEFMGLVPLAGKRLYYQPFEFKMLAEGGIWDESSFLNDISGKRFSLILLYDPKYWTSLEVRWTLHQRGMLLKYYTQQTRLADTRLQVPKE